MIVRWTEESLDDLERLFDFLAMHDPGAASRAVDVLLDAPSVLLQNPRLGRRLPLFGSREVRRLVVGSYELRYELAGDTIYVVRLWHTREDR